MKNAFRFVLSVTLMVLGLVSSAETNSWSCVLSFRANLNAPSFFDVRLCSVDYEETYQEKSSNDGRRIKKTVLYSRETPNPVKALSYGSRGFYYLGLYDRFFLKMVPSTNSVYKKFGHSYYLGRVILGAEYDPKKSGGVVLPYSLVIEKDGLREYPIKINSKARIIDLEVHIRADGTGQVEVKRTFKAGDKILPLENLAVPVFGNFGKRSLLVVDQMILDQ